MSFRELRNFTEMMRALGYPRLISLDNFRTPNFELVADILYWLVKRYDPDIAVSDNIESEDDRVEFLVGVAHAMINKAHIKLNARRLYAADGNAVRELLKLASVLYDATRAAASGDSSQENSRKKNSDRSGKSEDADADEPLALLGQLGNVKAARQLATEITERGAKLHDLLGREKDFRRARFRALAFLDAVAGEAGGGAENRRLEGSVRELVAAARDNAAALARQSEDLAADEAALDGKIQKASIDLDRTQKRFRSLQSHRPAFADELEKLEGELQRYYEVYLERFRNLDYLEGELERHHKSETEELLKYERWRDRTAEENRNNMMKQFLGRMPDGADAEGAAGGGGGSGGGSAGGAGSDRRTGGGGGGDSGRVTASYRGGGSSRGSGDVTAAGSDSAAAGRRERGRDARGGGLGGSGGRPAGSGGGGGRAARAENGRSDAARAAPRSRGGEAGGGGGRGGSGGGSGGAGLDGSGSGSDLDGAGSEGGSSSEEEVSLNNSEETGSLVDDDDESSRGGQSRSYSASDAEAF